MRAVAARLRPSLFRRRILLLKRETDAPALTYIGHQRHYIRSGNAADYAFGDVSFNVQNFILQGACGFTRLDGFRCAIREVNCRRCARGKSSTVIKPFSQAIMPRLGILARNASEIATNSCCEFCSRMPHCSSTPVLNGVTVVNRLSGCADRK